MLGYCTNTTRNNASKDLCRQYWECFHTWPGESESASERQIVQHRQIRCVHKLASANLSVWNYLTQAVPLKEIRLRVSTFADDVMLLKDLLTSSLTNKSEQTHVSAVGFSSRWVIPSNVFTHWPLPLSLPAFLSIIPSLPRLSMTSCRRLVNPGWFLNLVPYIFLCAFAPTTLASTFGMCMWWRLPVLAFWSSNLFVTCWRWPVAALVPCTIGACNVKCHGKINYPQSIRKNKKNGGKTQQNCAVVVSDVTGIQSDTSQTRLNWGITVQNSAW